MIIKHTNEDFEYHWGFVDFNGKVVLDIGADFGSTAECFLCYGAKKVIACEGDDVLYNKLLRYIDSEKEKGNDKIISYKRWINSETDFVHLLTNNWNGNKVDVVKIDVEGYEKYLLYVSKDVIRNIKEYVIECHKNEIRDELIKKFENSGFDIAKIIPLHVPGFSVIYIVRRD